METAAESFMVETGCRVTKVDDGDWRERVVDLWWEID
jgi:hypothetical protein